MSMPALIFDRTELTRRRNRVANGIAGHDFLLQRVADDIAERLHVVRRQFATVLDLGAHHGVLGSRLAGLKGLELPPRQILLSGRLVPRGSSVHAAI